MNAFVSTPALHIMLFTSRDQVPNASQMQLAAVSSFWTPIALVMGPRNWFWISLGTWAPSTEQQTQHLWHFHLIIDVCIAGGTAVIVHALTCPATQSFLSTRLVLYVGRVSFAVRPSHTIFVFDGKCTTRVAICIRVFLFQSTDYCGPSMLE